MRSRERDEQFTLWKLQTGEDVWGYFHRPVCFRGTLASFPELREYAYGEDIIEKILADEWKEID